MDEYALLRMLHVTGAVLLIGNVTVTGFWAAFLYRARGSVPFRPVARAIMWADLLFTLGGGILLTVSGILLAMRLQLRVWDTPWLLKGIAALAAATLVWLVVLLPYQLRLERNPPEDERGLRRLFLGWTLVGWADTAVLFYGLWAMVGRQ
ncbi:MAG: DUF2269 family protein [Gemmatimonadales bacterium]|nr:DUF2269 family protein [Gemmatimonadales bacterium]